MSVSFESCNELRGSLYRYERKSSSAGKGKMTQPQNS